MNPLANNIPLSNLTHWGYQLNINSGHLTPVYVMPTNNGNLLSNNAATSSNNAVTSSNNAVTSSDNTVTSCNNLLQHVPPNLNIAPKTSTFQGNRYCENAAVSNIPSWTMKSGMERKSNNTSMSNTQAQTTKEPKFVLGPAFSLADDHETSHDLQATDVPKTRPCDDSKLTSLTDNICSEKPEAQTMNASFATIKSSNVRQPSQESQICIGSVFSLADERTEGTSQNMTNMDNKLVTSRSSVNQKATEQDCQVQPSTVDQGNQMITSQIVQNLPETDRSPVEYSSNVTTSSSDILSITLAKDISKVIETLITSQSSISTSRTDLLSKPINHPADNHASSKQGSTNNISTTHSYTSSSESAMSVQTASDNFEAASGTLGLSHNQQDVGEIRSKPEIGCSKILTIQAACDKIPVSHQDQNVVTPQEAEVVDVESEDVDDCLLVKIDLSKHFVPFGLQIHNTEVVIHDSDTDDDSVIENTSEAKDQDLPSKTVSCDTDSVSSKDVGDKCKSPQRDVCPTVVVSEIDSSELIGSLSMEVEEINSETDTPLRDPMNQSVVPYDDTTEETISTSADVYQSITLLSASSASNTNSSVVANEINSERTNFATTAPQKSTSLDSSPPDYELLELHVDDVTPRSKRKEKKKLKVILPSKFIQQKNLPKQTSEFDQINSFNISEGIMDPSSSSSTTKNKFVSQSQGFENILKQNIPPKSLIKQIGGNAVKNTRQSKQSSPAKSSKMASNQIISSSEASAVQTEIASSSSSIMCKICYMTFSSRMSLVTHTWNTHRHSADKSYKCEVCDKSFPNSSLLKLHHKIRCSTPGNSPNDQRVLPETDETTLQKMLKQKNTDYSSVFQGDNTVARLKIGSFDKTNTRLTTSDHVQSNLNKNPPECTNTLISESHIRNSDQESNKKHAELDESPTCHFVSSVEKSEEGELEPNTSSGAVTMHSPMSLLESDHIDTNEEVMHECSKCQTMFSNLLHFKKHTIFCDLLKTPKNANFECFICHSVFTESSHIYRHMLYSSPRCASGVNIYCFMCNNTFTRPADKQAHLSLSMHCWLNEIQLMETVGKGNGNIEEHDQKRKKTRDAKLINEQVAALKYPSQPQNEQVAALKYPSQPQNEQVAALKYPSQPQNEQVAALKYPSQPQNEQFAALKYPSHPQNEQVEAPKYPSHPQNEQVEAPKYPSQPQNGPSTALNLLYQSRIVQAAALKFSYHAQNSQATPVNLSFQSQIAQATPLNFLYQSQGEQATPVNLYLPQNEQAAALKFPSPLQNKQATGLKFPYHPQNAQATPLNVPYQPQNEPTTAGKFPYHPQNTPLKVPFQPKNEPAAAGKFSCRAKNEQATVLKVPYHARNDQSTTLNIPSQPQNVHAAALNFPYNSQNQQAAALELPSQPQNERIEAPPQDKQVAVSKLPNPLQDKDSKIVCPVCRENFETKKLFKLHLNMSKKCKKAVKQTFEHAKSLNLINVLRKQRPIHGENRQEKVSLVEIQSVNVNKEKLIQCMICKTHFASHGDLIKHYVNMKGCSANKGLQNKLPTSKTSNFPLNPVSVISKDCHLPFKDDFKLAEHLQLNPSCHQSENVHTDIKLSSCRDNELSSTGNETVKKYVKKIRSCEIATGISSSTRIITMICTAEGNKSVLQQPLEVSYKEKESKANLPTSDIQHLNFTNKECLPFTQQQAETTIKEKQMNEFNDSHTLFQPKTTGLDNSKTLQVCEDNAGCGDETEEKLSDLSDSDCESDIEEDSSTAEENNVEYKCKLCDKTFHIRSQFIRHTKIHHPSSQGRSVHCKVCTRKFHDLTDLQAHLLQFRYCFIPLTRKLWERKQDPHLCNMCRKSLKSSTDLRKHCFKNMSCRLRYVNEVIKNIKTKDSSNSSELFLKESSETDLTSMKTRKVVLKNEDNSEVSSSVQDCDNLQNCNLPPNVGNDAVIPSPKTTPTPQKDCLNCGKAYIDILEHIFTQQTCLNFYGIYKHKCPVPLPFCFQCKQRFDSITMLTKHVCKGFVPYTHTCTSCDLKFTNMTDLNAHIKTCQKVPILHSQARNRLDEKITVATNPHSTQHHNQRVLVPIASTSKPIHSTEQTFPCLICDAKFPLLRLLMEHSYQHEEETPLKCDRCGSLFVHYNQFVSHQTFHIRMDKEKAILSAKTQYNELPPVLEKLDSSDTADADSVNDGKNHKVSDRLSACLFCHQEFPNATAKVDHISNTPACLGIMRYIIENKFFTTESSDNQFDEVKTADKNHCEFCEHNCADNIFHYLQSTCIFKLEKAILRFRAVSCYPEPMVTKTKVKESTNIGISTTTNTKSPFIRELSLSCHICKERFDNQNILLDHQWKEHGQLNDGKLQPQNPVMNIAESDSLYCFTCSTYLRTITDIENHKSSTCKNRTVLPVSIAVKADLEHIRCTICNFVFTRNRSLFDHMIYKHCEEANELMVAAGSKASRCSICSKTILVGKLLSHFKQHKMTYIEEIAAKPPRSKVICVVCKRHIMQSCMLEHLDKHKVASIFTGDCKVGSNVIGKTKSSGAQMEIKEKKRKLEPTLKKTGNIFSAVRCKLCDKVLQSYKTFKYHFKKFHVQYHPENWKIWFSLVNPLEQAQNFVGISENQQPCESNYKNAGLSRKSVDDKTKSDDDCSKIDLACDDKKYNFSKKIAQLCPIGSCKICQRKFINFPMFKFHLRTLHNRYSLEDEKKFFRPIAPLKKRENTDALSHSFILKPGQNSFYRMVDFDVQSDNLNHLALGEPNSSNALHSTSGSHDSFQRVCLMCRASFNDASLYQAHLETHITPCKIVLNDYFDQKPVNDESEQMNDQSEKMIDESEQMIDESEQMNDQSEKMIDESEQMIDESEQMKDFEIIENFLDDVEVKIETDY